MAIALIQLSPRTAGSSTPAGTLRTGETGHFPLTTSAFNEGETLELSILTTQVGDFPVDGNVRITTSPAQFVADGIVRSIGAVAGSYTRLNVEILSVTTARDATTITSLNLQQLTVVAPTASRSTAVTAANSGFVQSIFTGNRLSTNRDESGLEVRFGPTENITRYPLRPGAALPAGAIISNAHDLRFNILVNV